MKTKLTCILSAIAITAIASSGAFNNNAASSAPGKHEVNISAVQRNAPPATVNFAAAIQDAPAGTFAFAPLAIPNPNSSTVTSKNEALSIGTQNDTGITAGANSGTPQNTTTYAVTNVDTGETAATWTKTNATDTANAPNTGSQEGSTGIAGALFGGNTSSA